MLKTFSNSPRNDFKWLKVYFIELRIFFKFRQNMKFVF